MFSKYLNSFCTLCVVDNVVDGKPEDLFKVLFHDGGNHTRHAMTIYANIDYITNNSRSFNEDMRDIDVERVFIMTENNKQNFKLGKVLREICKEACEEWVSEEQRPELLKALR